MNWLRKLFGMRGAKRTRRPTGKHVAQAWKEGVRRACEDNKDASIHLIRAARKPDSVPTLVRFPNREAI